MRNNGYSKAYLHSNDFSAHPEEKEFLIGYANLKVTRITEEEIDMSYML